jgi:hypothetical protein
MPHAAPAASVVLHAGLAPTAVAAATKSEAFVPEVVGGIVSVMFALVLFVSVKVIGVLAV